MQFFIFLTLFTTLLFGDINLIKKGNPDSNTTLLVIGGIHGNEPGGYFAPAILATHYKIKTKALWVIPNLNKESIIAYKRGIHGDMNRKFAGMKKGDKDKKIVDAIKKIILNKKVSLILNLHDGHGFYRHKYQTPVFNPKAWGQACIIDQCALNKKQPYYNLESIATKVQKSVNKNLLRNYHLFNVKNTKTKKHDRAMQLSLTYFAVTHNKPAFAIETSKYLSKVEQKVFYQLCAIEGFMKIMGIQFSRDFKLNEKNIKKIIKDYGILEINHNILLNLNHIKKTLSYIPIKSKNNNFYFSNPLGVAKKNKNGIYDIFIGNIKVTSLKPEYFKIAQDCPNKIDVIVDGELISLKNTSSFLVKDDFKIVKNKNYRVNVIGYPSQKSDESGVKIAKKDLVKRYAIDKTNSIYRIELYKKNNFCSMLMVKFK